ncbi:helix-turn-helix domain-containing protein [Rhodococcus sp. SJ-2]
MADSIGAMVRRRRDELNISAQKLADACTELGHPIARNSISNLENGRRSEVSIAELAVLAEALDMPPVELLFGAALVNGEVEYLPGRTAPAWRALRRFTGEVPDKTRPRPADREYSLWLIRDLARRTDQYTKTVGDLRELSALLDVTHARLADPDLDDETRREGEAKLSRLRASTAEIQAWLDEYHQVEALSREALEAKGFQVDPTIGEQA